MMDAPAIWRIIRNVYVRFTADDGLPLAGNIAFRTILSIFPFLIILTALAGFIGNLDLARDVVTFLMETGPDELVAPFVPEIQSILSEPRSDFLSLGILLTLWTASGGVDSIRIGLNRAYGLQEHRRWHVLLIQNALFVVAGLAMLLSLALLIVFGPIMVRFLEDWVPGVEAVTAYYHALRYPVAVLFLSLAVTAAHLFLPARWLPWRQILPGICFTVCVWLAVAVAYSVYLARIADFASTYAGLGGLIAGMIFLYLMAAVLLLGGELNRALRLERDRATGRPEGESLGDPDRDKGDGA